AAQVGCGPAGAGLTSVGESGRRIGGGAHHARAPGIAMIAGTSSIRTIDASISTATAIPTASIFTAGSSAKTKLVKTATMTAAAVVMTRPVAPNPMATLVAASPVRSHSSWTRDSKNTS